MTRTEAIKVLEKRLNRYHPSDAITEATRIAIVELRRTQPENKPLTMDELRQMDGEPVWIVWPDGRIKSQWWIVGSANWIEMFAENYPKIDEGYGKTWLAYREKPGEEA